MVKMQATAIVDGKEIDVTDQYDLTPDNITSQFKLKTPNFSKTARWGAFGNGFEWDSDNASIYRSLKQRVLMIKTIKGK